MISEDVIQRVKNENDIVDIISESVRLKKAGRNFIGICPFHSEKTPSFSVSQEKQIYKCFGCGEAGNVISFIMKTKNMSFNDAIFKLAEKANIEITHEGNKEGEQKKNQYDKYYKMNVEAARFFYYNLKNNKTIFEYFIRRGITLKTITNFGLGYALDDWGALIKFLKSKGYSELDMLEAGLIIKSEKGKLYDRFRNRVMFPVFNYSGKVIGFGGRVLDDSKPKYLNSPETQLFKKGINLYGLNFSIKNQIKDRTFIIVEGYMDCISLQQYGIKNTVASLGTALTINQAKLLKRYADKVIIAYDADLAGQAATLRGLDILRSEGFDLRVLIVPNGKDPDEFIRNNGKEAFNELINKALPLVEYKLMRTKENLYTNNSESVINYTDEALRIIGELEPVERDIYINKLSDETKIKTQALYDSLNKKMKENVKKTEDMNMEIEFGQKLYLEPKHLRAEITLLSFMIKDENAFNYILEKFDPSLMLLESHRKIFGYIVDSINNNKMVNNEEIELKCKDVESSREWVNISEFQLIYKNEDCFALVEDYIKEIKKYKLEETKKEVMMKIKQYEEIGKFEETLSLASELVKINRKLGEYK